MFELDDVLNSGGYENTLWYDNYDWFVGEVKKLETKIVFYSKNTNKDTILSQKDEGDYRSKIICRFCEKEIISDKVRNHCPLTGIY